MTTRDGLITSEFDDAAVFDDDTPLDEFGDYDARDIDDRPDGDADDDADEWDDDEEEGDELDVDLELVVFGLSGTTVADADLIERAFARGLDAAGIADQHHGERVGSRSNVSGASAGASVDAAFRALAADADQAQHARAEFETAYVELVESEGVRPVAAAADLMLRLRAAGVQVALTTEFSRRMLDAALRALGWQRLADVTLTATEAGRGRPFPDVALIAMLRTGTSSVEGMVVVGDTAGDIVAGIAAGAGLVVGVLTGADDEKALLDAGADAVIPTVADLPQLLGFEAHDARAAGAGRGARNEASDRASSNVVR